MRRHPVIGHEILKGSASKYVRMGALIALGHHEKYDGSGYPNGLVGDHIPLCARIVAVADVYDALTSVRPYKTAWPSEQAFEYLAAQRGRHFDPRLVDAFVGVQQRGPGSAERMARRRRQRSVKAPSGLRRAAARAPRGAPRHRARAGDRAAGDQRAAGRSTCCPTRSRSRGAT